MSENKELLQKFEQELRQSSRLIDKFLENPFGTLKEFGFRISDDQAGILTQKVNHELKDKSVDAIVELVEGWVYEPYI
jgi:hypothetical protein